MEVGPIEFESFDSLITDLFEIPIHDNENMWKIRCFGNANGKQWLIEIDWKIEGVHSALVHYFSLQPKIDILENASVAMTQGRAGVTSRANGLESQFRTIA